MIENEFLLNERIKKMLKAIKIFLLSIMLLSFCGVSAYAVPVEIIDLVGDKDLEEWSKTVANDDGWGIIHEQDDPCGFDIRQVGTTVSWTHDISDQLAGVTIGSIRLDIASVGLIDNNWDDIDNRLFINNSEIEEAFDDSYDGWRLYSFNLSLDMLVNGCLNLSIVSHKGEGWGGPDYSELFVFGERSDTNTPAPVPEPATMLLLGSGLAGFGYLRRKK